MSDFDRDTALRREGDTWTADLQPRWNVGNNPNGGYLLAIGVRAMLEESARPDPVTVTAHFLSPPADGLITVRARTVKTGRTFSTVTAELVQGQRERVRLLGAVGDLSEHHGPTRVTARPPDIPPPDQCVTLAHLSRQAGRNIPEIMNRFDIRLPADSPWGGPGEGDPFEITGWIRFRDEAEPSTISTVAFADAFPPTLLGSLDVGWIPTVEMTVHVRARPAAGWLLGTFRTRVLVDGLLEEDGELWDSQGRPIALSRQLAMVLTR